MVFVLAFIIMLLVVTGMAIGVMAGRGPLKGSCGGLSAVGIDGRCDICGDYPSARRNDGSETNASAARFYDASTAR